MTLDSKLGCPKTKLQNPSNRSLAPLNSGSPNDDGQSRDPYDYADRGSRFVPSKAT